MSTFHFRSVPSGREFCSLFGQLCPSSNSLSPLLSTRDLQGRISDLGDNFGREINFSLSNEQAKGREKNEKC